MKHFHLLQKDRVRHRGVTGRVPAFQLGRGGSGSIPGGVRNFNFYPGNGCVSFVCVLSCIVSGGGTGVVLTILQGGPPLCICLVSGSQSVATPTGI